jgi:four helix bundle protein
LKNIIIQEKSYSFSLRIVKLYKYLLTQWKASSLAHQILRSGTSIGANVEEAIGGTSKKDFINKLSIAYKEARETHYWLKLLKDSSFINEKMFKSIEPECIELCKILFAIIRTSRNNP